MNVREEIERFSSPEDKPILNWLFNKYHWESEWKHVAICSFQRYGSQSYQVNRVWMPTPDGVTLYRAAHKAEETF